MANDVLPEELRSVLRLSLKSTGDILHALKDAEDPIDINNPAIKKLVEQILFSRRFILSYYVVLALVIITCTVLRLRFGSREKERFAEVAEEDETKTTSVASSSSSTLQGSETSLPKNPLAEETLPLLRNASNSAKGNKTDIGRLYRHARAALVTQPAPGPALTASQNVLPSNGVSLVVCLFLALNVFYLFYRTPLSRSMLFAFADRAGLLFVVNLPILYVLGAKNNQPLRWLTGWSYEGLNIFHRRLGEWMTVAAVIHGVSMIVVWSILLRPLGLSLGWYLTRRVILLGIFAFLTYLAIYATSIGYVRQAWYEAFLGLHIFFQVSALILLFFHHHNARPYVAAALAVWVIDRILFRMFMASQTLVVDLQIADDGETVLLFAKVPLRKSAIGGISAGWKAGQHAFVTIPALGWTHRLQAHPFTIASPAPPRNTAETSWPLLLIIRAQTGFSKALLDYAKFHQHTLARLDGPYGSTDVIDAARESDRTCFIAGGSGIAVTYPLAWNLCFDGTANSHDPVCLRTTYQDGKKHTPLVHTVKLSPKAGSYSHLWVRQVAEHDGWIRFMPRSKEPISNPGYLLRNTEHPTQVVDLVTLRFTTRVASHLTSMRPNLDLELREWIEGSGVASNGKDQSICIVVSGPDTLVRGVRKSAARLVKEGWDITVWVEKFGW